MCFQNATFWKHCQSIFFFAQNNPELILQKKILWKNNNIFYIAECSHTELKQNTQNAAKRKFIDIFIW